MICEVRRYDACRHANATDDNDESRRSLVIEAQILNAEGCDLRMILSAASIGILPMPSTYVVEGIVYT